MNEEAFLTLDTFVIIVLLLKDWQIHALWSTGKELHSKPWIWNTRVLPYLCRWQKVQLAEWGQMKFRLYLHGCSIYLDAQGTLVGKAHLKPTFLDGNGMLYKGNSEFAKYWFDFEPYSLHSIHTKGDYNVVFLHIEYTRDSIYREDIIHVKRCELATSYLWMSSIKIWGTIVKTRYFDRHNNLYADYF